MAWLRDQSSRYSMKSSRRGVSPLHVLEGHHDRADFRHALEEEPPGREQVLFVPGASFLDPE